MSVGIRDNLASHGRPIVQGTLDCRPIEHARSESNPHAWAKLDALMQCFSGKRPHRGGRTFPRDAHGPLNAASGHARRPIERDVSAWDWCL